MQLIIDRFEGEYAVCERPDRTMVNIPRAGIPETAREGDVLMVLGDKIVIDREGTARRKKQIEELTKDLWK